jgi:hypothetical protein
VRQRRTDNATIQKWRPYNLRMMLARTTSTKVVAMSSLSDMENGVQRKMLRL